MPANRQLARGKRLAAGCSRRLQNPFPATGTRAIINAVYGFFQSFPPESWRVYPRPGPFARDRALLSPRRTQQGQAPTRCVMRCSGVEPCPSGIHIDAGHHAMLAPFVSIANIVQEVKAGTDTVTQAPEPFGPTPRAHATLRSPLTLRLERALPPAASSRPAPLFTNSNVPAFQSRSGNAASPDR